MDRPRKVDLPDYYPGVIAVLGDGKFLGIYHGVERTFEIQEEARFWLLTQVADDQHLPTEQRAKARHLLEIPEEHVHEELHREPGESRWAEPWGV